MDDDWGQLIFKVHPVIPQPEPKQPLPDKNANFSIPQPVKKEISPPVQPVSSYTVHTKYTPQPVRSNPVSRSNSNKIEVKSINQILRIDGGEDVPWNSNGNVVFDDIISETIDAFAHPLIYDDF